MGVRRVMLGGIDVWRVDSETWHGTVEQGACNPHNIQYMANSLVCLWAIITHGKETKPARSATSSLRFSSSRI